MRLWSMVWVQGFSVALILNSEGRKVKKIGGLVKLNMNQRIKQVLILSHLKEGKVTVESKVHTVGQFATNKVRVWLILSV